MIQIPYKINKLSIDPLNYVNDNPICPVLYHYEDETGEKKDFIANINFPPRKGKEIVDADTDFYYHRRVLLDNGKFSFLDFDGNFSPFEFDIAGGFNEYGLAMVGTLYGVTWINREFKRLNSLGKWVPLIPETILSSSVSEFVCGLSALEFKPSRGINPIYINTDGVRKEFIDNKGNRADSLEGDYMGDASFDEDGYKITAKGVYFSAGRFLDFAELAKCDSFSRALSDINRKFIEENAEKTLLLEQINAEKK